MIGNKSFLLLIGAILLTVVNGQFDLRMEACEALCGSRYGSLNSDVDLSGRYIPPYVGSNPYPKGKRPPGQKGQTIKSYQCFFNPVSCYGYGRR